MRLRLWLAVSAAFAMVFVASLLGGGTNAAEEKEGAAGKTDAASRPGSAGSSAVAAPKAPEKARDKGSRLTIYVPPSRGAVGARTGGGTRGVAEAPRIAVLAPDHIGLTTRAQPKLAWYLSANTSARVELTLIADGAVEPLAVTALPGPFHAGIHVVDLARHGVRLEDGTTYDWFVALVLDPNARDADVVAGGAIQRRAAAPGLVDELAQAEPSYRVLARHGIWYDSIADLSDAIAASSASTAAGSELRAERAALLEQVGVGAVAVYEREGGDGAIPAK